MVVLSQIHLLCTCLASGSHAKGHMYSQSVAAKYGTRNVPEYLLACREEFRRCLHRVYGAGRTPFDTFRNTLTDTASVLSMPCLMWVSALHYPIFLRDMRAIRQIQRFVGYSSGRSGCNELSTEQQKYAVRSQLAATILTMSCGTVTPMRRSRSVYTCPVATHTHPDSRGSV